MKNAIKYGLLIGLLSGFWIMVMHLSGVYTNDVAGPKNIHWMEYLSILIPFSGLYFGLRNYNKIYFKGKISPLESLMQGFKIMLVGLVLSMVTLSIYLKFMINDFMVIDFMQRLAAAGGVGIILVFVVSLILANKPQDY